MDRHWGTWADIVEQRLSRVERRVTRDGPIVKGLVGATGDALRQFREEVTPHVTYNGDRVLIIATAHSRQEITLNHLADRGVWRAGESYCRGDLVSYGGSAWIAQTDTAPSVKPGAGQTSWRLAVKRGSAS